ncbi:T6SS phospholipase effector Tle1-like catalytic domain-containing protein [Aliarcobacter skirrowii]|uniref:T6SS phospholipase effector Tle1-like catalytic domain-containing protein n=1 Tax=Aliarcobacter skirrowii TaxID=28200 RepID=UPI0029BD668F|nr:DUF2235 domain-containing protein [Aliarcobacter skirrowii]MDX4028301.1 DUF2235 domain-containing protein [Aliarcobacter skirrowii]
MIREYFINENIEIKAQTLGMKDGDNLEVVLIFLEEYDGNKKLIEDLKKEDFKKEEMKKSTQDKNDNKKFKVDKFMQETEGKIVKVENGKVKYSFKIEEHVAKENIDRVKYIICWIDLDGDHVREYDEAIVIKINHMLQKNKLRMGIFFDGTGNDISDKSIMNNELSNVRKLFEVYPNQLIETSEKQRLEDEEYKRLNGDYPYRTRVKITNEAIFPDNMSAYVRGVGSISSIQSNDWFGGAAFGSGGEKRVQGMLYYINVAIEEYVKEYQKREGIDYYPVSLEFDVFGFSRGASLARHFVNLIKQYGIRYDKDLFYHPSKVKIRTLNVFDTVGSFGLPGNDINIGYSFHVEDKYIEDKIHHFIADDEFRSNFPGSLIRDNDKNYPEDIKDTKVEELILLGAHSDIGGGYPDKFEHNLSNNELSKYYLEMMYNKCKGLGMPLHDIPEDSSWQYNEDIKTYINSLSEQYLEYPNLKIAHKRLREIQAYLYYEIVNNEINKLNQELSGDMLNSIYSFGNNDIQNNIERKSKRIKELKFSTYKYNEIEESLYVTNDYYKSIIEELSGIFKDKFELEEFIRQSNEFQDRYVHRSYSGDIGMSPRLKDKSYHREYYISSSSKIKKQEAKIFYSNNEYSLDKKNNTQIG